MPIIIPAIIRRSDVEYFFVYLYRIGDGNEFEALFIIFSIFYYTLHKKYREAEVFIIRCQVCFILFFAFLSIATSSYRAIVIA